jgi:hypothetical protein
MEPKGSDHRPKAEPDDPQVRKHLDELLDDALRESFPASDVPSVANPVLDAPVDPRPGVDAPGDQKGDRKKDPTKRP